MKEPTTKQIAFITAYTMRNPWQIPRTRGLCSELISKIIADNPIESHDLNWQDIPFSFGNDNGD